uniref:Uncharacterized protein LOC109505143 n=1 Tax=Elaeis guineensis var. tenera TaxID=51953 RepID=A0A6J0PEN1_ELAGV|nr:uncharacterized protein LOC109505143 [Elaeis guineensis]
MTKTRAQRSRVTGSARRSSRREEASPPSPAAEPSSPRPAVTTGAQIAAIVRQMTVLTDAVKSLQQQPAARPMPSRSSRRRPHRAPSPLCERSQQRSHGEEGRPRCDDRRSQRPSPSLLERARKEKRPRTPSASLSESSGGSTPGVSQHRRADDYERRFEEIDRRLAQLQVDGQKSSNDVDFQTAQPLSRLVLDEPIPSRFKIPHVEPYDGSTDPVDHLESYKALMTIQVATDTLFCIGFPATLRKAARAWYSGLRSGSIHSFAQLEHSFVAHFSTSQKPPRTSDSLFSLKQGENETLRHFVARFNAATLEVRGLNEDMAVSAMKRGLRSSRFTYSLDKTLPRTYAELLERAYKYMRADEGASDRRLAEPRGPKEKRRKGREPAEPSRPPTSSRLSPPRQIQKRFDKVPPCDPIGATDRKDQLLSLPYPISC